ncbi:hypothetical protein N9D31_02750 [Oligoflexaceae bacterium]|nr:hypothetical protein [Oligoflexaceae bacterium]
MKMSKDNVVSFNQFKSKKENEEALTRGREPLFVSHRTGKMTGSPHFKRPQAEDFGDRLSRIKTSLEKINKLMGELKKTPEDKPVSNISDLNK